MGIRFEFGSVDPEFSIIGLTTDETADTNPLSSACMKIDHRRTWTCVHACIHLEGLYGAETIGIARQRIGLHPKVQQVQVTECCRDYPSELVVHEVQYAQSC